MDMAKSSVFRPNEVDDDPHPHACTGGLVFLILSYTVFDEAVGDEVERIEAVPPLRG
jgi:hypothetical protein